jgi:hypothetical protein
MPIHLVKWLQSEGISILNVAGPRESTNPGIQAAAKAWLLKTLALAAQSR